MSLAHIYLSVFIGLLLSHSLRCQKRVSLFPNGEVKLCRNHTSNPSSISFTCNIEHSTLVWIFTYGNEDTSEVVTFVYGNPSTPVYPAVGARAVIKSQSSSKMISEFFVTVNEGITPFKLSCGLDFNKFQTFSLAYKEPPGLPTNLHVRESIPNHDRKSLNVFFDWSPPDQRVDHATDIPDKYILYATTFSDATYEPTEVRSPGGYLTLKPHLEYMVVVQSVNCAGYSARASMIVHLDDSEARLPKLDETNSVPDSQFKIVAHEEIMKIEFPEKGAISSNIIDSFKDQFLGIAGISRERLFLGVILMAPLVLSVIAVLIVSIIALLFLCTCHKMRMRYSKLSFKDFEEAN